VRLDGRFAFLLCVDGGLRGWRAGKMEGGEGGDAATVLDSCRVG